VSRYPGNTEAHSDGPRIMLVDDSLPFLRNFSAILTNQGYDVRTSDSGIKAAELAAQFRPQLISLDYDMPGLDGIGTLLQVKMKHSDCKIIFISGKMDIEAVTQALTNGASECVTKPVDLNRLLSIVKNLVGDGRRS
jgi:DNA-binding response OmpR family regulator